MQNKLQQFNQKKIAFLGLGIENQSMLDFFVREEVNAKFSIYDTRTEKEIGDRFTRFKNQPNINLHLQAEENDLASYDYIFRSPGFPLFTENLQKAKEAGVQVTSAMKLFFDLCPSQNIIAVTGSKGKGTSSSLIHTILNQAGIQNYLGGNIGVAPFSFIQDIKETDWVVLELSSFQLEDMEQSPHIAVITNLSEEHLKPADPNNPNYHKSMSDYVRAKLNILKHQQKGDYTVLNEKFKGSTMLFVRGKDYLIGRGKRIYFGASSIQSRLIGNYNKENIGAAVEVAKILKIKNSDIKKAVLNFKGLPHRIEFTREVSGVKYYDNSFATTPEATMADLESFVEPVILFLGGADKGSSFLSMAKAIVKKNIKYIVLLDGEASNKINQELLASGFPAHKITRVSSMAEGVKIASREASAGDIVLLSTACASFGMFRNYKERGDIFQKEVNKI